jgi:hypothetical protein
MAPRRPPRPTASVAVATLALLVTALTGCAGSGPAPAPTTSAVPSTSAPAPTTTVAPTTTTTAVPPAPQASPAAAAQALVDSWVDGDRAAARRVATTRAVAILFAHPYAGQTVISRGCSTEFPPLVCSYGPYGGGAGTLYEVDVEPAGANWYVSSVSVEG